ncbi:MAG: hypothetical protein ACO3NK_08950 [Prochlorotrichaceae cyanobacterium]
MSIRDLGDVDLGYAEIWTDGALLIYNQVSTAILNGLCGVRPKGAYHTTVSAV